MSLENVMTMHGSVFKTEDSSHGVSHNREFVLKTQRVRAHPALTCLSMALAMQQRDVHFGRQGAGVKLLNHFNRRSCISSQSEQVDVAAIN